MIPADGEVHDPIIQVPTDQFSEDDSNDRCSVTPGDVYLVKAVSYWRRLAQEYAVRPLPQYSRELLEDKLH